jgi:signal transduction histidine kinase
MAAARYSFGSTLSLSTKGMLLIAVPVAAQIGMLAILRSAQTSVLDAERWAIHSKDVILRGDDLNRAALQAIANQRASVISGDPDFRDNSSTDVPLAAQLNLLEALVADNPPQRTRLGVVRERLDALEGWIEEQRQLVRQGRQEEAAVRVRERQGSAQLDAVRKALATFMTEEERLSSLRSAELRRATEGARLMTLVAAAVSFVIACIFAYLFSRAISARFAVLTANAAQLASGGALTAPLIGSDEIARLDAVLHATGRQLFEASSATQRAQRELEARLDELAVLNRELRHKTEENETFIYSVSHDLRSPLVNLQGFSKELALSCASLQALLTHEHVPVSLRERTTDLIDRDIAESLRFIRTAVSRASDIIDSLLRLSRAGRIEYRWARVNMSRVVTTVVDAMRATISAKAATVVVSPLSDAWGDSTALEQVFANLLGNAVNYLDPSRPGRIEIGMLERGTMDGESTRTYYVRDNGLGIPEAAMAKIFTAFLRHHVQHAAGEGVGLALVRRIVERHRGRIWVESKEGVGSTFYVELPVEG